MYGSLDISASGMIAQRTRMNVIAANLVHQNTFLDAAGQLNPYRRREAMFAPGDPTSSNPDARELGVHVASIQINQDAVRLKWDPDNPYAYQDGPNKGYLPVPDIDPVTEQINAIEATRAYDANVAAAEATKSMIAQALRLIA